MASSSIQLIDDDEQDFDWDAAVREIDIACSKTLEQPPPPLPQPLPPSTSLSTSYNNNLISRQLNNHSRQLTLDKFLSNTGSNPVKEDDNGFQGEDGEIRVSEKACFVDIDLEAAKTWIYPENVPRREYQVEIAKTALFSNTLVALPTGLGKTLIAAVVMFNYFRWFPEGKIVFATPSRPLVMQQIEACHNTVGIPQEWTIDMTGLISPPKRAALWKSKRVFFVTPQVLEKDIQSGTCLVKNLVCLVIDEAHRAMGNYSYCVAVRELLTVPVELRILALTATPGSKKETIQQVIDNLQISTLEYRSESDVDVCPYVHNRSIELIEVPMGKDADEIYSLFNEVIRPIAARLCAIGLLPGRDFQTLSPCDLLNSRDKFRQAPPPELSHVKYSEVEGYFGVLITLYHIRKLLTSHGIRPAHEMLEEKLRQGYFARLMSRNESIQRAKVLMQKSLSHGAPSPKLSKMIEVLVDHFRTNDPQNSRVIIFSNFRGSVRDILDSLAHVGHSIKATQFIGQSTGKTLKGQSHKVQQAVLEKFRMGGYNVIVATSIGEEGLDIMEVDLVICFDANISPLRMIQRMGRTGRKHDGRVVVLACEGTEVRGYKRKQATGKTVRKHMQNGGMNSFNFHCSPRMVPHLVKPEMRFVQISIEKFIRQAKKVKIDSPQPAKFRDGLTDSEAAMLKKYFLPNEAMSLSLVAFPSFQAYPSRVHKVMHSSRTGWLIDAMQLLHGLSLSNTLRNPEPDFSRGTMCLNGSVDKHTENGRDEFDPINLSAELKVVSNSEVSTFIPLVAEETCMVNFPHRVLEIADSLPTPPSKHTVPKSSIQDICEDHLAGRSQLSTDLGDEITAHASPFADNSKHDIIRCEISEPTEPTSPAPLDAKCDVDIADFDFSPRLTSFIESGLVPESPLSNAGEDITLLKEAGSLKDCENGEGNYGGLVPESISTPEPCRNSFLESTPMRPTGNKQSVRPPGFSKVEDNHQFPTSPEFRTPFQNLTNSSCSKDWQMSSGKKSGSIVRPLRLKRLRRIGDIFKETHQSNTKQKTKDTDDLPKIIKHCKVRKPYKDARDFIDEEAEVSSEDVVPDSEDENVYEDSDAYEESFIDDQSDPAVASGQTEDSKPDMMAIYRRSLLTQSTFLEQKSSSVVTPESVPSKLQKKESLPSIPTMGNCFEKIHTLQTPRDCLESPNNSTKNLVGSRLNLKVWEAIPSTSSNSLANVANTGSWKRKMISRRTFTLPAKNLEKEFCTNSSLSSKQVPLPYQADNDKDPGCAAFFDDQFYEGLDFDELEAKAVMLISQRAESSAQRTKLSEPLPDNDNIILDSPSFDLGIL